MGAICAVPQTLNRAVVSLYLQNIRQDIYDININGIVSIASVNPKAGRRWACIYHSIELHATVARRRMNFPQ